MIKINLEGVYTHYSEESCYLDDEKIYIGFDNKFSTVFINAKDYNGIVIYGGADLKCKLKDCRKNIKKIKVLISKIILNEFLKDPIRFLEYLKDTQENYFEKGQKDIKKKFKELFDVSKNWDE